MWQARTWLPVVLVAGMLPLTSTAHAQVFLPGTQPEEGGIELAKMSQCKLCHYDTPARDDSPYNSWSGGMMSQAARDPVYLAALTIANQDVPGVGEYCLRCHSARGWFEGRSGDPTGARLTVEDRHGVSCEVCHRLVDPTADEAASFAAELPPGPGNGMMVADPGNVVRGPYPSIDRERPHLTIQSAFQGSSELCGTCHDVSNPLFADDVRTQQAYAYGVIERTYSEWKESVFATRGAEGTCQSCHMPLVEGGGIATKNDTPHHDYYRRHGAIGASTWVQDAVAYLYPAEVDTKALAIGKERARALLATAATLEVSTPREGTTRIKVTNHTGHKLPTGYPEGRRMWLRVAFLDADGAVIQELGSYGPKTVAFAGSQIEVPTLLDPDSTRVYQALPGLSKAQSEAHGVPEGKSFHFVLNDQMTFDNRIPPEGYGRSRFAKRLAAPVGVSYADGQHWDTVDFAVPEGTTRIEVELLYQSVSWEYIRFLYEENRTDDAGERLLEAWSATGQCPPEVIAATSVDLP